jgi:hypothetical protein
MVKTKKPQGKDDGKGGQVPGGGTHRTIAKKIKVPKEKEINYSKRTIEQMKENRAENQRLLALLQVNQQAYEQLAAEAGGVAGGMSGVLEEAPPGGSKKKSTGGKGDKSGPPVSSLGTFRSYYGLQPFDQALH